MIFSSQPSYLGVDLGASAAKIVELANEGKRARLVTYGILDEPLDVVGKIDPRQEPERVGLVLRELTKRIKTTTVKTFASLPTFSVFTSIMNVPTVAGKDLAAAVRWEAKKIVPLPIDDMVLDWKKLPSVVVSSAPEEHGLLPFAAEAKPHTRVLLTAAAKDLVKKYIEVFRHAGLQLMSLETEAFALIRSLVGAEERVVMLVDIGAVNTDISVIDHGIPFLNRSIDTGGLAITKVLADSLSVAIDQAEQMKRDFGAGREPVLPETLKVVVEPIVNELSYCMSLYERQRQVLAGTGPSPEDRGNEMPIDKIILTGGSSELSGLSQYLAQRLNIRVLCSSPWARIMVPKELEGELGRVGPRLSIAIGLAMRDIV